MTFIECMAQIVQCYVQAEPDFADDPFLIRPSDERDTDFEVGVQLYDLEGNESLFTMVGIIRAVPDGGYEVADFVH